jgi:hypothetical protein
MPALVSSVTPDARAAKSGSRAMMPDSGAAVSNDDTGRRRWTADADIDTGAGYGVFDHHAASRPGAPDHDVGPSATDAWCVHDHDGVDASPIGSIVDHVDDVGGPLHDGRSLHHAVEARLRGLPHENDRPRPLLGLHRDRQLGAGGGRHIPHHVGFHHPVVARHDLDRMWTGRDDGPAMARIGEHGRWRFVHGHRRGGVHGGGRLGLVATSERGEAER